MTNLGVVFVIKIGEPKAGPSEMAKLTRPLAALVNATASDRVGQKSRRKTGLASSSAGSDLFEVELVSTETGSLIGRFHVKSNAVTTAFTIGIASSLVANILWSALTAGWNVSSASHIPEPKVSENAAASASKLLRDLAKISTPESGIEFSFEDGQGQRVFLRITPHESTAGQTFDKPLAVEICFENVGSLDKNAIAAINRWAGEPIDKGKELRPPQCVTKLIRVKSSNELQLMVKEFQQANVKFSFREIGEANMA